MRPECSICGSKHFIREPHVFKEDVKPLHEVLRVKVVHAQSPAVVHAPLVVHDKPKGSSRHGKYLDETKRKKYRKEWMKVDRAVKSGRAELI